MFTVIDDDDLDTPTPTRTVVVTTVPVVTETVTVTPIPPTEDRTHARIDPARWNTSQLLSYVAEQIERCHGPFPRNAVKEKATLGSFRARWGAKAGPIARYAFEQADGMWLGAPIGLNRFLVSSDPSFGAVIVEKLS